MMRLPTYVSILALAGCAVADIPSTSPGEQAEPDAQPTPETWRRLFPTRVFTRDAVVTIHSPTLDDPVAEDVVFRAALDVFVDAEGTSYAGVARMPATLVAATGEPPLLVLDNEALHFDFPTATAEHHAALESAAGFAFARQPTVLRLDDVADPGAFRRLSRRAPDRGLTVRRSDSAVVLEQARTREALRRAARWREFERLRTDPRAAPEPVTPRQRYFERGRRFGPTLGPSRGLHRGDIGRR